LHPNFVQQASNHLFMKRSLIALTLVIGSVGMLALANKGMQAKKQACPENVCCKQKPDAPAKAVERGSKTDFLFWEPVGRLMLVTH